MLKNIDNKKGFSIVELLVVIIIIGILATIGFMSYNWAVEDAQDSSIKAYVDDIGKALVAIYTREGKEPERSGYFSNKPGGVDETLSGYTDAASRRSSLKSKNATDENYTIFRYWSCDEGGFTIYASLNNPTEENKNNLQSIKSRCGNSDHWVPTDESKKPIYNYAKYFPY